MLSTFYSFLKLNRFAHYVLTSRANTLAFLFLLFLALLSTFYFVLDGDPYLLFMWLPIGLYCILTLTSASYHRAHGLWMIHVHGSAYEARRSYLKSVLKLQNKVYCYQPIASDHFYWNVRTGSGIRSFRIIKEGLFFQDVQETIECNTSLWYFVF